MSHTYTHKSRKQIIDILASRTHCSLGTLLLILTLVNITFTCTTYVAASVLICVSCQRAACLVKSGNQNINGDGVRVEVPKPAVQSRDRDALDGHLTDCFFYGRNISLLLCSRWHTVSNWTPFQWPVNLHSIYVLMWKLRGSFSPLVAPWSNVLLVLFASFVIYFIARKDTQSHGWCDLKKECMESSVRFIVSYTAINATGSPFGSRRSAIWRDREMKEVQNHETKISN